MTPDPKTAKPPGLIQKGLARLFPERGEPAAAEPAVSALKPPEASAMPAGETPTLAAVARYRIQFLDNSGRALYPLPERGTALLSRGEEQIAFARCLEALHEAKAAGRIIGMPAAGAYQGRDAEAVMGEAGPADLHAFLAFVLANPRSFMQRPCRISEAFLAWLVDRGEP